MAVAVAMASAVMLTGCINMDGKWCLGDPSCTLNPKAGGHTIAQVGCFGGTLDGKTRLIIQGRDAFYPLDPVGGCEASGVLALGNDTKVDTFFWRNSCSNPNDVTKWYRNHTYAPPPGAPPQNFTEVVGKACTGRYAGSTFIVYRGNVSQADCANRCSYEPTCNCYDWSPTPTSASVACEALTCASPSCTCTAGYANEGCGFNPPRDQKDHGNYNAYLTRGAKP